MRYLLFKLSKTLDPLSDDGNQVTLALLAKVDAMSLEVSIRRNSK
jgi:hypothetical protein